MRARTTAFRYPVVEFEESALKAIERREPVRQHQALTSAGKWTG